MTKLYGVTALQLANISRILCKTSIKLCHGEYQWGGGMVANGNKL